MSSVWLTRSLLCMCAMTFLVAMGFSLMVPILPLYVREFGASNIQVGAVVAGFALARTAFNLPAGIVAARLGSKNSILLGLVFVGVTSVVIGLARNYETVLLARAIAGIGSAFFVTSSVTYMAELTSGGRRGRSMSIYDGASMVGSTIGPAIGGALALWGGMGLPFLAYACFLFGTAVLVKLFLSATAMKNIERQPFSLSDLKQLYSDRSFLSVNASTFMYSFVLMSMEFTIVPLFATSNIGLNALQTGGIFTVLSVAQLVTYLPMGSLSDRFGRKPFMISSLVVSSLVLVSMPYASSERELILVMVILGFGVGLSGPTAAWISDLSPTNKLGIAIGLYRTLSDIGVVMGPLFLTAISQNPQVTAQIASTPFLVGGILMAVTAIPLLTAKDPAKEKKTVAVQGSHTGDISESPRHQVQAFSSVSRRR